MKTELHPDHVVWTPGIPLDDWLATLPVPAATAIADGLEQGTVVERPPTVTGSAGMVAGLGASAAAGLGLPPPAPFGFDLRLSGAIGKPGATLSFRWLQPGRTVPAREVSRGGLWLRAGERTWRIASPVHDVLGMVERFNAASRDGLEEQFRAWADIREALGEEGAGSLTDAFLKSCRVVGASALTFAIVADENGDLQIEPVLLASRRQPDGEGLEHVRALTEADEQLFTRRLDQLPEGRAAFPVGQGTYVVVDEEMQRALSAVRRLRQAPPAQRKRAAMFPEAVFREMLDLPEGAPTVFVETERFADRVRDVGEWTAPVVPWIRIPAQQWDAPVEAGIRIDGVDVPVEADELESVVSAMRDAMASGKPTVEVGGRQVRATAANLRALEQLQGAVRRRDGRADGDRPEARSDAVLIIETNLDQTSFSRTRTSARPGRLGVPSGLRTTPKAHQESGILWLQRHWVSGSRGAMLCDDMGLGKTFQALAFCRWLRNLTDDATVERRPILIVAPVGLLWNWEAEMGVHLEPPGLGSLQRAYGDHLRALRRGRHIDGTAGLDTAALARADVVLANYEAVSDYQLSFGAVPFQAVILDEAQKVKSPGARMTHAVKALNAEFMLAMTGTPVENRLADLWCIADAVQPGALADLKEFSARYERPDSDVGALRSMVWHDEDDGGEPAPPRLLLRRLKSDKLEGLPRKHEHVTRRPMPPRQAEAYGRALALRELSGPEGTLGMIHALRRISLHPVLFDGDAREEELRIEDSARLSATVEVLDQVAEAGEKALVFLESLDLQEAGQLPTLLQRRYGMRRPPLVINGQVGTEQRQARVDTFQTERGFDVMLLSPKAGGVGLTLTAANHVIHLSRWWNPAVEDQCSDRVYRIGQHRPVHIHYPLAVVPGAEEHSFDVQLQLLMERKRKLAQDLLVPPAFTKDDYEALMAGTAGQGLRP